jgi:hypothetical protein
VLSGTYTPRYASILHDLTRLALVTGARLDEVCSLKTNDAHKRETVGGSTSVKARLKQRCVRFGSTDSAAHVLERRSKSSDHFVFEGLVPGVA